MKNGKTLNELAAELTRQSNTKRDFIADPNMLTMLPDSRLVIGQTEGGRGLAVNTHAHRQLGTILGIPAVYYDKMMKEQPALLASNVNAWLARENEARMIRTLDGNVRAVLSRRYRPLDNYDLANAVLPILTGASNLGAHVVSCELTMTKMYIKVIFTKIEASITTAKKVGDVVQAGIAIGNSEVGSGQLVVQPLVYTLSCLNGMISESSMSRRHVGGKVNAGDDGATEIFRDETLAADDRAFWMKVQDTVRAAMNEVEFRKLVNKLQDSTQDRISGGVVEVMDRVSRKFSLTEGDKGGILNHLIEGGDLSRYGLLNAVTRYSQDVEDYDRATDFERMGGTILELPRHDWQRLTEAA